MAFLPKLEVEVTADTDSAEAGLERVGSKATDLGRNLNRTTKRTAAFGRGVQNASFQLGDFAVQVGGGVDASRALAQQLPQLLGGFGVLGAVLGAVVAVAIPLKTAIDGLSDSGRDVTEVFGTLQPVMRSIANSMQTVAAMAGEMAEVIVNNVDRILVIAGTAAALFAGKWVVGFVAARVATMSLAGSLLVLRGALIRTGIGALVVGAGELVYQFTRLSQAAGGFGEALSLIASIGTEAWGKLKRGASLMGELLGAIAMQVEGAFVGAFASITEAFAGLTQAIASGMNALFGTNISGIGSDLAAKLRSEADYLSDGGAAIAESAGGSLAALGQEGFASIQRIRDLLASMKDENITLDSIFGGGNDEEGEGGGSLKDKLAERESAIAEHLERIRALTQGGLSSQLGAWGNYFTNLASLTGSNNAKLLGLAKSFAAAQSLINAWQAHNQVLADPTLPWFAKIASAANVLAAGIGAVSAIRSVSASGSSASAGGVGGGASGGAAGATAQQPLQVSLSGINPTDLFSGQQVLDLIFDGIQDRAGDRGLSFVR